MSKVFGRWLIIKSAPCWQVKVGLLRPEDIAQQPRRWQHAVQRIENAFFK